MSCSNKYNYIETIVEPYQKTIIEVSQFDEREINNLTIKDAMFWAQDSKNGQVYLTQPNTEWPTIGSVWYIEGPDGMAQAWKSNYDSSD